MEQSLANFFRKGNLNMLRELALRTTAEQVGNQASEYRRTQGLEQAPIPEKVMVCLSTRPGTERLLRVGARIAGRLATNWYAVYVTRPDDDKGHGDPEAFHRLEEYQRMARDLGAQVVSLTDRNVSDALIRFAQQENISHVVFGQSVRSRWDILLRGSVLNRFLSEVRDVTVQVVPVQADKTSRRRSEPHLLYATPSAGQQPCLCDNLNIAALIELVAQLVEQRPFKAWVVRSNRTELTISFRSLAAISLKTSHVIHPQSW